MKKIFFIFFSIALIVPNSFCAFPELKTAAYCNMTDPQNIIINDPTDPAAKEYGVFRIDDFFLSTDAYASTNYAYASSRIRLWETGSGGWYITQENTSTDNYPNIYGVYMYDIEVEKAELRVRAWVSPGTGPDIQSATATAKLMW